MSGSKKQGEKAADSSDHARMQIKAQKVLEGVNSTLKNRFNELRDQHFNTNTKGYEYEKIVAAFFGEYFGGIFDFHTRKVLLDRDLKAFEVFDEGQNEFDVVATFRNASPRLVMRVGEMTYLPYDGTAFVIEVKQTLERTALKKDLDKLRKLDSFDTSGRFGTPFKTRFSIERPLKILFYYEAHIDENSLAELLDQYAQSWDLVLVVSKDILYGNKALPVVAKDLHDSKDRIICYDDYSLFNFMKIIQFSITVSPIVNTLRVFGKLVESSLKTDDKT
jgi:hypothetical protein